MTGEKILLPASDQSQKLLNSAFVNLGLGSKKSKKKPEMSVALAVLGDDSDRPISNRDVGNKEPESYSWPVG